MKVLNIDAFVRPKRSVTLDGVDHVVQELEVDAFIQSLAASEAAEKAAEAAKTSAEGAAEFINLSIKSIAQVIPTIPETRLRKLPIEAIGAINKFVRGELDEQASEAVNAVIEEGSAEKKPL